ncbi:adenosylcobinamide-GDP ribazoletransferase [Magnetovibrio blakemorei]|uniref:adenosylcobinamide-GDP ribazoletransferase n=1 Tax=Magnetovibrio blakemorei TaxID=28181 RepID=UPI000B25CB63|nr:adenosylcobinamide-GDP ribazoletransferase [Magnetovibrio blakemorei]
MSQKESPLSLDPAHQSRPVLSALRRWMDRFTLAWLFLTRVPLPKWWNAPLPIEEIEGEPDDKAKGMIPLADTVRTWPLVGLFIGALTGLALWAGAKLGLHPIAAGFVALMVGAVLTGALHEDGLADVADGFGGGASKAKKLAIMKDSHIGTYGVLALLLVTGFKATCLGGFNGPGLAAGALVGAHVLSRAMMPLLMAFLPPARSSGLGRGAGAPSRDDAVVSAIIGVLLGLLVLGLEPGALAAVLALSGAAFVAWLAHRQIGGYTGDVLGAAQQVAEALILAGMAGAFRTVFYI